MEQSLVRLRVILSSIMLKLKGDLEIASNDLHRHKEIVVYDIEYLLACVKSNDTIFLESLESPVAGFEIGEEFTALLSATVEMYGQDEQISEVLSKLIHASQKSQIPFFVTQSYNLASLVAKEFSRTKGAFWLKASLCFISKRTETMITPFLSEITRSALMFLSDRAWISMNPDVAHEFFELLDYVLLITRSSRYMRYRCLNSSLTVCRRCSTKQYQCAWKCKKRLLISLYSSFWY
jgi:hypothetical protein